MAKVFIDVGMSVDGFIAGPNGRPDNPLGDGGTRIHEWVYSLATFHDRLGMSGGQTGPDDDMLKEVFARCGAYVMGRRMFDEGEVGWPENAPFRAPVFVVTHKARAPWVRPGGTTFHFVTEGTEKALQQARRAAGDKDIRVSGGANIIQQYLKAGVVDEMTIHLTPVLMGAGVRLLDNIASAGIKFDQADAVPSSQVTHLSYQITK